ncbi:hypothetical protein ACIG87_30360 [Micromonospora sp. NPDC051925]|uniref:hypothetical protein n=1 Tax=Micromonospora sp. NPDC051925 TaxID=3364288 RepID=UPI0037C9ABD7
MDVDAGEPIGPPLSVDDACFMWWELKDTSEADPTFIAVGTLAGGGWYVRHTRYGSRRFAGKESAWAAVRRLMARSRSGRWQSVPAGADRITATHPGPHHPLLVAKAALNGYRAAYTGRPPVTPPGPRKEPDCCSEYGFAAGTRAGQRDRRSVRPGTPYAELPTVSGDWHRPTHPAFHDPSHVILGVAAGYLAGRSGQPPELLRGHDCCFAFGYHEAVRSGEDDYYRATADEVHRGNPGTSVEAAERELRLQAFRRRSARDGLGLVLHRSARGAVSPGGAASAGAAGPVWADRR